MIWIFNKTMRIIKIWNPPLVFFKTVSSRERVKPWLFVTFNIIISHIFFKNFNEIPQVVQKIWRFSPSILTIFINFSDFLTFPCYKETNGVSIKQMMSSFFYFQPTIVRLFNNYKKLYWYEIRSFRNMKSQIDPCLPRRNYS